MLQAPPAKPYVVQSPDFEDVDLLFGYDKQREKQGEGPDSVHEHNHASVESVEKQTPGNDITQALPLYDVNPKPAYPDVARSRGWQGRVLLEVSVGADGTVDKVALMESSGYRVLDKAARKIVYRWKFIPAHVGGVSVPSKVQVPIDFLLNAVRG
jgi:TonB family protein